MLEKSMQAIGWNGTVTACHVKSQEQKSDGIWKFTLNLSPLPEFGSCFPMFLAPSRTCTFPSSCLLSDGYCICTKEKTHYIIVREGPVQFFPQHCFQDLKSGRYRGSELLHEDRIDSVNQRENLLSGSQTFNLLLRIIRTPKSLCRPFLLDRYSHVLIFLLQK